MSLDDGDHWQPLRLNLPDTQVSDITIKNADVVIATHGRSLYILDDIDWLRQYSPEAKREALHVYKPGPMTLRVDEATIDYSLSKPATRVTIEILKDGKVVKSFVSAKEQPEEEETGGERRPKRKPPTAAAGLNRFAWNGQYAGPVTFPKMIVWGASASAGPNALPGDYQVRVTADRVSQMQPLKLLPDPRYPGVSQPDLQKQFDLASRINADFSEANAMVLKIRAIREALAAGGQKSPQLKAAAEPFLARLTEIEETLYQVRNRSGQDPLNFPIKLNNQIAALGRKMSEGYGAPPQQFYTIYDLLHARLSEQRSAYDRVTRDGFSTVNPLLARAHLKPLSSAALDKVVEDRKRVPWDEKEGGEEDNVL